VFRVPAEEVLQLVADDVDVLAGLCQAGRGGSTRGACQSESSAGGKDQKRGRVGWQVWQVACRAQLMPTGNAQNNAVL